MSYMSSVLRDVRWRCVPTPVPTPVRAPWSDRPGIRESVHVSGQPRNPRINSYPDCHFVRKKISISG